MCGVTGVFHYRDQDRPVDRAILLSMTRSIAHRGPDGEGTYAARGIGLGHRRLAILDTSDVAAQPMVSSDGTIVLTYNGEIYNFRELRAQLEANGHRFVSGSDTEVVLHGYREWGDGLLDRVEGIFGFGLWDARRRRLLLARDQLGVKPLFFADDGRTIRFGSEIKAILSDPSVARTVDLGALNRFLTLSFTPAPFTGFSSVRQLLPGHKAVVDAAGVKVDRYYAIQYAPVARDENLSAEVARFEALLDRVTKAQMVSDVPVGAFLSGGLDSAAVVRSMTRAGAGAVHALTVGFDARGFDETPAAAETARALGVDLEVERMQLTPDLIPRISLHVEDPFADSSIIPVWLLCRAARKRFTVAMSGDGADDILAGYDTYRATLLADHVRRLPRSLRERVLLPLAERLPISDRKYGLHRVATRFLRGVQRGPGRDHASWRIIFDESLQARLLAPELRLACHDPLEEYAAAVRDVPAGREAILGPLHADTAYYLPNDMLVKVDRMSMAHGLEVRVPFLDVQMVAYAANLAGRHKLKGFAGRKHILRESLRSSIPATVLALPKSGFNAPIESWLRGPLRDLLLDTAAAVRHDLESLIRVSELERVVEEHRTRRADHAHALFTTLMLALWLQNRQQAWRGRQDVIASSRAD